MKSRTFIFLLLSLALTACAVPQKTQLVSPAEVRPVSMPPNAVQLQTTTQVESKVGQPVDITTEKNPLKQEFLRKARSKPLLFRPSENMPEVTNEDLIHGMSETGKNPNKNVGFVGYLPTLKVIPACKGCEGKDYDQAVAAFVKAFDGDSKLLKKRGTMVVKVRWFKSKSFMETLLPFGSDEFGVAFLLEGKRITLGKEGGIKNRKTAKELAGALGGRLAVELVFSTGMGVQPTFLAQIDNGSFAESMHKVGAAVDGLFGVNDVRPRIEPATDEDRDLLPAIDGININEIAPLKEPAYINTWLF